MSKHETAMTRTCWRKIGGALCEEYPLVKNGKANGWRKVDGLIVLGEPKKRAPCAAYPDLKGRDIVLLQTKANRLGMSVMGQALFSRELALAFGREVCSDNCGRDKDRRCAGASSQKIRDRGAASKEGPVQRSFH